MQKFSILIAGCGEVGCALAVTLAQQHRVYGLRRSTEQLPPAILPIAADLLMPQTMQVLPSADILVYCAAPSFTTEEIYTQTYVDGLRNVLDALEKPPAHIFFTSSTGVYHQDDHQWINERSITLPTTKRAKIMLAAERQVLASGSAATVVRFSGIYGAQRLHLLNQVRSGKVFCASPVQYSNRIHLDDCAAVLAHLINKLANLESIAPLYLASDHLPSPISEVMSWLATATNTQVEEVASSRKTSSKRCDNSLLLDSGYRFIYPDFKAGYQKIIADQRQIF
ncbi:MAG: hypothetical protein OFPII_13070 [Osedax symbiont Rs1]|nr:MAG: hypothetical protein OFPII_13070 [Osedax symbiont Rs1]